MGLYWVYYRKHISVEASLLQAHPKTPGKSVRPQDPTNKVSPVMSSPALRCFPKKNGWAVGSLKLKLRRSLYCSLVVEATPLKNINPIGSFPQISG